MASDHSSLEEMSKCSVCLEHYKSCLEKLKECRNCRKETKRNFESVAIKEVCNSVMEAKRRRKSEPQGALCLLHTETQKLFCTDDQKLVCMECVSHDHQTHSYCSISKAANEHRDKLQEPLKNLKTRLQHWESQKSFYDRTSAEQLQSQVKHTEMQIKGKFEKLHQFLREEEESRMAALMNEVDEKSCKIKAKIQELEEFCSGISEQIKNITDDMKSEDSLFLHNFTRTNKRAQHTVPDPKLDAGPQIDVAKHLGNLSFKVWEKMKDLCPYYPVILDPSTNKNLAASQDLISVTQGPTVLNKDQISNFLNIPQILGSEGFTKGTHTWEVEIGKNEDWVVGIVKKLPQSSQSPLKNECIYIGKLNGESSWNPKAPSFTKVRVIVDHEKGQATFVDPDTNTTLQSYKCAFTGKMYPFLGTVSTVPVKILPAKVSVSLQ